jgi:sulfatase maturation enzyme AslB (radical SAM superfamily)
MYVNPLLLHWKWKVKDGCSWQVIPHPTCPGDFIARIILRVYNTASPGLYETFRRFLSCDQIASFHVFVEGQHDDAEIMQTTLEGAVHALPAELGHMLSEIFFKLESSVPNREVEYFIIWPGNMPSETVYPVWTRDINRSRQVVEGKYGEIVPVAFEFVPTLNCIFRCHECAYRVPKEKLGVWKHNNFSPCFHMDENSIRILIKRLRNAGVNEILFTGGGEPLLNEATPNAMQFARELGMRVGLYTNGALMNAEKAKIVMEARPDYVRISLNAGGKRSYYRHHNPLDKSRKINYFTNTQKALKLLAQIKAHLQSTTILGVSYLVDTNNAGDVGDAARLIGSIASQFPNMINYIRFTPSVNYLGSQQHPQELFQIAVRRIETEAVPILTEAGIDARVYYHRFSGLYERRSYDRCLAASWFGGIGPQGIMYWCCERLFNPFFAFGSLLDKPFDELWFGAERQKVMEFANCAVKGCTDLPCPVLCKPHEHNKVFAKIESLRDKGQIALAGTWLSQIHAIVASAQSRAKPRLDGFHI